VKTGWEAADLSDRQVALCRFADQVTLNPEEIEEEDLEPLMEADLSDEEILTLAHIIGFFNGVNRIADCLHVDPEPDWS
jgi:uncharacterized peroxidase-related enzyme